MARIHGAGSDYQERRSGFLPQPNRIRVDFLFNSIGYSKDFSFLFLTIGALMMHDGIFHFLVKGAKRGPGEVRWSNLLGRIQHE